MLCNPHSGKACYASLRSVSKLTLCSLRNIDAAVYSDVDVEKCIERELEKECSICDIDIMEKKLQSASNVLIIGDNTGETIFDKVMIESFTNLNINYGVRSEWIINDVTEKEAVASGLDQVSKIVSTGCSAPGAILEDCSDEFRRL